MEKGNYIFQQSRICVLGILCALIWFCLLFFHFGFLESRTFEVQINPIANHSRYPESTPVVHPITTSPPAPPIDVNREPENPQSSISRSENPKFFPFMKAMRTVDNKSDPCGGRYVFVHDLPPRFNEDMVKECKSINKWFDMCKFVTNYGLGPPLENSEGVFSDNGWYATNQFSVDVIFNNRMKQYECLTNDSSIAAAIFVPFYAGFDAARYLWGYNISMRDAASLDLVNWLQKRPEWRFMGGKDHFLVGGRITWDFRRLSEEETDWGNKFLFLPAAKNMSLLIDQCKNSEVGKLLECGFGESKCHSPSSVMKMFQNSVFCLQPQGDSYTRRSAFDSILAGCIPVFFHPGSAYTQYTWHLPKNYTKYSVFIPEDDIRKNASIEQILSRIPSETIKKMRDEVVNLIPRLIYADPRSKLETLKDAFDVSVESIIKKVKRVREDMINNRTNDDFIEELSWKYALLEEGEYIGVHEWDPFFSKPKPKGSKNS
ncbi:Exostosin-like protein [Cynara cardunculus var. scolymus]|uniref:Exostosin-like protein n=1 Tax=Cynara cardunculus var. scolymus TaxID=59895 RepID=A0A103XPG9_CYNCS|nr:Exostosin-like protein [Cynara cardunculus var. scolymus]